MMRSSRRSACVLVVLWCMGTGAAQQPQKLVREESDGVFRFAWWWGDNGAAWLPPPRIDAREREAALASIAPLLATTLASARDGALVRSCMLALARIDAPPAIDVTALLRGHLAGE